MAISPAMPMPMSKLLLEDGSCKQAASSVDVALYSVAARSKATIHQQ